MKYKVGDEVLVKAAFVRKSYNDEIFEFLGADKVNHKICPDPSSIYEPDMTAEEAWEIAKKISLIPSAGGLEYSDLQDIFGTPDVAKIIKNNTPQQAKAKIEAWEAAKEIKVGDEVDICGDKGIVTSFGTDGNRIHVLYYDGIVNSYRIDKGIKKTGRSIDIEGLLKQIGEDE